MNEVTRLSKELAEAQADAAMYERLTAAAARVAELTPQLAEATAKQEAEEAARAAEEYEAQFEGVRDLRVTVTGDIGPDAGGAVWASYEITFVRPTWESWSGNTVSKKHTYKGFHSLPPEVFRYLLDKVPEQIPAGIMELAPGDPRAAFNRYFSGRKRGHL